ncbi:MAG: recombination protein O N-terminal domain-containing protein [Patescibacteria group bacterium]
MAYEKYTTPALVLGAREYGDADRVFVLFTRDFGLVRARASSARRESSRLRYGLATFARSSVSLVKGKRGWRLVGSSALVCPPLAYADAEMFSRITSLLLRLVHGEDRNDYLFETLVNARETLGSDAVRAYTELLCVTRMLYALGYISKEGLTEALFAHALYTETDMQTVRAARIDMAARVNGALTATNL